MIRILVTLCCVTILSSALSAQQRPPVPDTFDFWIGTWNTTMSVAPKWNEVTGVDSVSLLLGGRLIEEVFTKKKGEGIDNFQRGYLNYIGREKRWKHVIHDETWGDYTFYGNREGDRVILKSDPAETRQGMRRETFYEITPDSFEYLWEASYDGGKTWRPEWKVSYKRVK